MSALQHGAVALAIGYLLGAVPFARIARRRRDQASANMKMVNSWQRSFERLQAARDFSSGCCLRARSAEQENGRLRARLASAAMESNRLRRELNRAESTPPRAGVDA